LFVFY